MKNLVFIRVSNNPKMSDSLNAILVLSYFPCSDFPGLLVCDKGDFREMHTTKIVFVADTSTFFANVTGLSWNIQESTKNFHSNCIPVHSSSSVIGVLYLAFPYV